MADRPPCKGCVYWTQRYPDKEDVIGHCWVEPNVAYRFADAPACRHYAAAEEYSKAVMDAAKRAVWEDGARAMREAVLGISSEEAGIIFRDEIERLPLPQPEEPKG